MLRRPLTVITVIAFICALLFASVAWAQETTAGETTTRTKDAASAGAEATTSNVSAETGNSSSFGRTENVRVAAGRGAARNQYISERTVEDTVIKETIPNKGKLAGTGGMPLAGVALLSLAIVGVGVSILRSAIRRGS
jgi:hypothetical protein